MPTSAALTRIYQLNIYNGALRMCGDARLVSLTDNRESRYLLDDVWNDGNGIMSAMLEQGLWYFATRTSQLTNDTSLATNFGYAAVFEKPSDWIRTVGVCQDSFFRVPLTRYVDEAGYIYSDLDVIYFRYVSDGPLYGADMSRWPQTFSNAVQGYLAAQIVRKLTAGDEKKIESVQKDAKRLLTDARSKVAMNEGAVFLPTGSWVRGRWGNRSTNDQGNPNSLIG